MEVKRFGEHQILFLSLLLFLGGAHFLYFVELLEELPLYAPLLTLLVGVSSTVILSLAGYFHVIRPYPRKSDIVLMITVLPLCSIFSNRLLEQFFGQQQISSLDVLFPISLSLAVSVFLLHYILARYVGGRLQKKIVVLCLTPIEGVRFIHHLAQYGFAEYLSFVSFDDYLEKQSEEISFAPHLVVWSDEYTGEDEHMMCLLKSHLSGVPIRQYQSILDSLSGRVELERFNLWQFISNAKPQTESVRMSWKMKEFFEPLLAVIFLILFSPLFVLVAIAIKLTSRGPVIYSQTRVGLRSQHFTIYKFRTMREDAEASGPQWTTVNDSRVTFIGRYLRKLRVDELPQLVNILRGEMSFCGPRPERPEMYEKLSSSVPYFSLRTLVKPGVTGWAQIQAGYASSIAESKKKLSYDLFYIQNMSLRMDLVIILHTLMYSLGFNDAREIENIEDAKRLMRASL